MGDSVGPEASNTSIGVSRNSTSSSSEPRPPNPPLQLASLSNEGLRVYSYPAQPDKSHIDNFSIEQEFPAVTLFEWIFDGKLLVIVETTKPNVISFVEATNWKRLISLTQIEVIQKIAFSPLFTYMTLLTKHHPSENHQNVCVFRIHYSYEKGDLQFSSECSLTKKTINASTWPVLRWSSQESYCARMVTNEVHIFETASTPICLQNPDFVVRQEKVSSFSISPETIRQTEKLESGEVGAPKTSLVGPYVALFTPESKGAPAAVKIYDIQNHQKCTSSKNFYHAEEISFHWCPCDGCALLVLTQTSTDCTGKSYYGTNSLYFLKTDGTYGTQLSSQEEGPIHDLKWSPTKHEFLMCRGSMPPEVSVHEAKKGEKMLSLGRHPRNMLEFNPFGRFVVISGVGNLQGDVDVYDLLKKQSVGSLKTPFCVSMEFSPCGRFFTASTTSPRLRVDNRIKLFHYTGQKVAEVEFKELVKVKWRPCAYGTYLDRASSPTRLSQANAGAERKDKLEDGRFSAGAYRPPGSTGALAAMLRAQRGEQEPLQAMKVQPKTNFPPGYISEPKVGKSASRNARRKKAREAQRDATDE